MANLFLRIPADLKDRLQQKAGERGVSLNALCIGIFWGQWKQLELEMKDMSPCSGSEPRRGNSQELAMKLTKRKALEVTREEWTWLAETGGPRKKDWPGWAVYRKMEHNCPCCEYDKRANAEFGKLCSRCPLYPRLKDLSYAYMCEFPGEPYKRWSEETSIEGRKDWAQRMVDLCNARLEEL